MYEGMKPDYMRWEITWQWAHRILASSSELRYVPAVAQVCLLLALEFFMLLLLVCFEPHKKLLDQTLAVVLQLVLVTENIVGILCFQRLLEGATVTGLIVGLLAVAWAKTFPDPNTSRKIMRQFELCCISG